MKASQPQPENKTNLKRHLDIFMLILTFFTLKAGASMPYKSAGDTLLVKNYAYLSEHIDKFEGKPLANIYLKAYLAKAYEEKNWPEVVEGYKNFVHASKENKRLAYADSMIIAASKTRNNDVMGSAYLTKGIVHYAMKNYPQALDNYLVAERFIAKGNDPYLKFKAKYNIAHIKYYLGYYEEALHLFQECSQYFKDENNLAYISCLHSAGLCYNRMGKYELCSTINSLALKESRRLDISEFTPYLQLSEGVNFYFLKQYQKSLVLIEQSLKGIRKDNDFANESIAYFYLGKANMALGNKTLAYTYFRKVDYIFGKNHYLRPDMREAYEALMKYSHENGNPESELYYINRLFKADSLLNSNYKYLSQKIHKEYDTAKLIEAKGIVEKRLQLRKNYEIIFIVLGSLLICFLLYLINKYFKSKQRYKIRFEQIMHEKTAAIPERTSTAQKIAENDPVPIKAEVIASILKHLQKFESHNKYLQKELTAVKLAETFSTNHKYLSKVILLHSGKKFSDYVNDLRIDYIINLLKEEPQYRKYSNKALAEEAGFSTTQHFTNAFLKRAQISPSFFIAELNMFFSEMA